MVAETNKEVKIDIMGKTTSKTMAVMKQRVREYYVNKKAFYGLITLREVIKTDALGSEIRIKAQDEPLKVVINGKEWKKSSADLITTKREGE
jgi:hypothetical protein